MASSAASVERTTGLSAPARRVTAVDVTRTWWLDPFFRTWRFERTDELFAAVTTTDVDLPTLHRNADLSAEGLGGWGYWFLFLKGWLEYRRDGAVADENVYLRYMTRHFDAVRHDPGLADVLANPRSARERVALRFAEADRLSRADPASAVVDRTTGPIEIRLREPTPPGAKMVHEAGTGHPIGPALIDGHHRLFLARLFGFGAAEAEVVAEDAGAKRLDLAGRVGEILRFTVPPHATVAVVQEGAAPTLGAEALRTVPFPPAHAAHAPDERLVELLEEGRRHAMWRYLLVPAPAAGWLERRPELRRHLERHYRVAARDAETCVLHVLWEDGDEPAEDDALPLPPVEMRVLSTGDVEAARFLERGRAGLGWIDAMLERHGLVRQQLGDILDFGCGAGRILRGLQAHRGRVHGVDYNPYLMAWVSSALAFAETSVCGSWPGLDGSGDRWDLVLAIDVFTHFDARRHAAWIAELRRVTRPGGLLMLTLHGASRANELAGAQRERFDAGELVVSRPYLAGTNACAAYHPERYVTSVLAAGMEIVAYEPDGAIDLRQDALLLRRPQRETPGR